jgi:hypothetical protein
MEHNAKDALSTVRGLARNHSWEEIVEADRRQIKMPFFTIPAEPCMCFDGEE